MYIIIKPNILVCIRYMHKIVCWSPIGISWGELGIRGYPIPRCKYDLKARLPLDRKLFGKYDRYDLHSSSNDQCWRSGPFFHRLSAPSPSSWDSIL